MSEDANPLGETPHVISIPASSTQTSSPSTGQPLFTAPTPPTPPPRHAPPTSTGETPGAHQPTHPGQASAATQGVQMPVPPHQQWQYIQQMQQMAIQAMYNPYLWYPPGISEDWGTDTNTDGTPPTGNPYGDGNPGVTGNHLPNRSWNTRPRCWHAGQGR